MKRVKHFKLLVFLYFSLVFFFSGIISNFVHESIHVLQVKSQGFEPLDVCYWGYTNELKGACSWVSFPENFTLAKKTLYTRILFFKDIEFLPTLVEYVVTIISVFVFTILFIYSFEREYE